LPLRLALLTILILLLRLFATMQRLICLQYLSGARSLASACKRAPRLANTTCGAKMKLLMLLDSEKGGLRRLVVSRL
jgi:hypothetical protein